MGHREILDHLLVRRGFLERVQVVALKVLDQGLLEHLAVVGGPHDRRDGLQARPAGRSPTPLAGDELETVAGRADEDRLEQADLADGIGQRPEPLLVEPIARLIGVWANRTNW